MLQLHEGEGPATSSSFDQLQYAREIVRGEASALHEVAQRLDDSFLRAVDLIYHCSGRIAITGIGKSADVGRKIAGTFNSTGTRAYVLDATRAVHGDLGMVHADDVVLALSYSGESEELLRILWPMRSLAAAVIGLTGNGRSTLAREANVSIVLGALEEVCPLGLAPSTSTTAMIAVGDAIAFVLSRVRQFTREDFARFHPAGSLGRKLLRVESIMRRGRDLRRASAESTVREVFAQERRRGRRTGAVILVDGQDHLVGIFTDSDLARLIEERRESALDNPIRDVMTVNPITVAIGTMVDDAIEILRRHRISELPVVDSNNRPAGLIDITDVLSLLPAEDAEALVQVA
jgi:arabinose-5-phosphate isomerase